MEEGVLGVIIGFVVLVFIMRAIGAWMLRINDLIHYQKESAHHQKETNELLKQLLDKLN